MREDINFPTIRQAAKRGPLSERSLRLMQKEGRLPGFFVGNRFRINYSALLDQLQTESLQLHSRMLSKGIDLSEAQEDTPGIVQKIAEGR